MEKIIKEYNKIDMSHIEINKKGVFITFKMCDKCNVLKILCSCNKKIRSRYNGKIN